MREFDKHVKETLKNRIEALEAHFEADCIFFYGTIFRGIEKTFREFIELLKEDGGPRDRLVILLNSPGGSAETVEKLVEIIRHHYADISFVVPDEAMSAGTIFCMAGDRIYMDYSSSLGPIDPQIFNGRDWVPALGYLDQVEKMIDKSRNGTLTDAELVWLQSQDFAMLNQFEQAKNLTVTLLKKWLVEFKFKDWNIHQTTPEKIDQPVTAEEKQQRAEEIARILSDNKQWHSHGRLISAETLRTVLRLRIEDYSSDRERRSKIRFYNDFLVDYLQRHDYKTFLHSRCFF